MGGRVFWVADGWQVGPGVGVGALASAPSSLDVAEGGIALRLSCGASVDLGQHDGLRRVAAGIVRMSVYEVDAGGSVRRSSTVPVRGAQLAGTYPVPPLGAK